MTELEERFAAFRERNADLLHALMPHDPFPWHPKGEDRASYRTSVQVRLLPELGGLYDLDPRWGTCDRAECYTRGAHSSAAASA